MTEQKRLSKSRPISIKGLTFEEAVTKLLKHKLPKEDSQKTKKGTKNDRKH